jgi:putative membrane protein
VEVAITRASLFAFLHHAAAFIVFGTLMVELVLTKSELTLSSARSLLRMDAAYGISASVLLVVGLIRVFQTEKGAEYYFHSGPFIAKLSLFIIVALLSIYPTVGFLKWRQDLRQQRIPVFHEGHRRRIRTIIHVELTLLLLIMLCAALMAKGIGFVG